MKLAYMAVVAMVLVASAQAAQAESFPLLPGYYEVAVSGGPSSEMRNRCVTAEHLADPDSVLNYAFAKKYRPVPGFTVSNLSVQGGKITYDVETPNSTVHVDGMVSATQFAVKRHAKSKKSGTEIPIMTLDGKRTRDCRHGD
ncbi:conserved exported protein of unknown function [Nitrospira japonica]|uniref:DUF3617 family protein n=1 Tax=Nitrospira japonica TaxID=1325564 RepID=A0A1W1I8T9_9BACT|nr:hypothetical protein [Nitrospira japonica]SLM49424.1 conserved exported protein of unknown function [Nitrospira japonica]